MKRPTAPWVAAAAAGAEQWTVFGLWELVLLGVLPRFLDSVDSAKSYHVGFSLLIIAGYAVTGAAFGLLGALIRPSEAKRAARALAAGTLLLVYLTGRTMIGEGLRNPPEAAYFLLLSVAVGAALRRNAARALARLADPWSFSLLILVPAWAVHYWPPDSAALTAGLYLLSGAALALLAAGAGRFADEPLRRRRAAALVSLAVLAAAGNLLLHPQPLITGPPETGNPRRDLPSVILISLDTVRADHLSVYGYDRDTTPALREFSRDALVFPNAVAAGDMTLISHASLFTGLAGYEHRAHTSLENLYGVPLADEFQTLAEILAAEGYRTSAVVANSIFLGREYGLQQGFQYFDDRWPALMTADVPTYCLRGIVSLALRLILPWSPLTRRFRTADEINQEAMRLLPESPESPPFFLFLNYMDAHSPYIPPEPFAEKFPGRIPDYGFGDYVAARGRVLGSNQPLPPEIRAHLISQYDGAIAYIDSRLGQLFEELKRRGFYERSLIIVTSDHGEAFGEDGAIEHSMSVHQDQVHVPLLIKLPGQRRTGVIDKPVGSRDVLPMILGILGIPAPAGVSGRDLLDEVGGWDQPVIAESYPIHHTVEYGERFRRTERAIYLGRWKLIGSTAGKRELYDLSADPAETTNLYHPGAELSDRLEAIYTEVLAASRKVKRRPLDRDRMKRLRSLGYVQN